MNEVILGLTLKDGAYMHCLSMHKPNIGECISFKDIGNGYGEMMLMVEGINYQVDNRVFKVGVRVINKVEPSNYTLCYNGEWELDKEYNKKYNDPASYLK